MGFFFWLLDFLELEKVIWKVIWIINIKENTEEKFK